MRKAYTISAIGHAAVLIWGMWSLAGKPVTLPASEALPIDLVTSAELSQITAGSKSAPKLETPKPVAEKIAEAKPPDDPSAKPVDKKDVKAAHDAAPPPESKPAEAKSSDKKIEDTKPDPVAEAVAKPQAKPEPKKAEAKPPAPKKPSPPAPKFDPKQVEALLDKRQPTRVAAAGPTLNSTPSLGLPTGQAAQLSLSELEALRARLAKLWTIPAGAKDPQELVVQIRIQLKPDGSLAAPPEVLNSGSGMLFVAARDSAKRAVIRGQPYDMLKPEHYEQWKDIEITFDPRDMIRG